MFTLKFKLNNRYYNRIVVFFRKFKCTFYEKCEAKLLNIHIIIFNRFENCQVLKININNKY